MRIVNYLKDGVISIDGHSIYPGYFIRNLIQHFSSDKIKVIGSTDVTVRFKEVVQVGTKKFNVRLGSENDLISSVNLVISDPTIKEWDYESKADQHGEWLCEQIGYPQGLLEENLFYWGKIIQWEDFRSRQTQINILYNN